MEKVTDRAYSILEIKSLDDDKRIITGIATTPSPDKMDDIVEPLGVEYKLPIPFLWQHNADKPVGNVTKAKVTAKGIEVEVQIEKTEEPGPVKDRLDGAWQDIKLRLVRGLSIGFMGLETSRIEGTFGVRFIKWLWLELSAVTIAANGDCSIATIKSVDRALRNERGTTSSGTKTPAGPARSVSLAGSASKQKGSATMPKMTIAEQIAGAKDQREKKLAEMNAIMEKAVEDGVTLDAAQKEASDTLEAEIAELDDHIKRLEKHDALNRKAAAPVGDGKSQDDASKARGGDKPGRAMVIDKKLPVGTMFTRFVLALARSKGDLVLAERHVLGNEQWMAETPEIAEIMKTAVNAGTTSDSTWAAPLVNYQIMVSEFIEYLRPRTIIGRIPGLRRVPFKIKIPRQTGAATVNWVGEGKVKPLTSMAFDTVTLEFAKIAGIIPLTEELVRFSNPSAEALVREELANAIIQFMDSQFVDPTKASNDVSPASITYGVTPDAPSGTTAAAFRADAKTLLGNMYAAGHASSLVWIMTQQQALALSLMQNSLGQLQFPGITPEGGTLLGYPVVASENIPAAGGSPTDGYPIIIARAPDILLADDGQVTIDASREASLQMETAPDSPPTASTNMVSLWQHNMIAIKAERYINWGKARSTAVDLIQGAHYAE